jgi:hypothetical protein
MAIDFSDAYEIQGNGRSRIQNRVLAQLACPTEQTEACVFAYLAEQGWEHETINDAIDALIDDGEILPSITHTHYEGGRPLPHYPTLRRVWK